MILDFLILNSTFILGKSFTWSCRSLEAKWPGRSEAAPGPENPGALECEAFQDRDPGWPCTATCTDSSELWREVGPALPEMC